MMHIIAKKVLLTNIIKTTETIGCTELPLVYGADGWKVEILDPAHVAMLRVVIAKDLFDTYEVDEDGTAVINLAALKESLDYMPIENTVDMTINETTITLHSGKVKRKLRMIADAQPASVRIPEFETPCLFEFNTADIAKILAKVNSSKVFTSDVVTFKCGVDGLSISIASDDMTDGIDYADNTIKSADGQDYKSSFPLDYMAKALSAMPQNVMVGMNVDFPILITATSPYSITYVLAPRIEQEE